MFLTVSRDTTALSEWKPVTVSLLGECRVAVAGDYIRHVPFAYYRIAAYLVLEGQPQLRKRIGRLLWSDKSPARISDTLRQTVARVRRIQSAHGFRLVVADATSFWLAEDENVRCDLVELVDLVRNPTQASAPRLCELYDGEFLASLGAAGGEYDEWLAFHRSSIHDQVVSAVSKAILPDSELASPQREYCARRLLALDPCDEGAYRALMRGAAERGHLATVRHLFDECQRNLRTRLGIGPDLQTTQLYGKLSEA